MSDSPEEDSIAIARFPGAGITPDSGRPADAESPSHSAPLYDVLSPEELRELLEHRDRQIEAIRRTGDAIFTHASVDAIVHQTLRVALEVLRADAGTLFLYEPKDDTLVFRVVIGGAGEKLVGKAIPASQGIAGTVFRTKKSLLTGDVHERGDFNREVDKETGYHTQSMMTVPVRRTHGDPIGVMQVLNAHVAFSTRDLEVLEVLCAQAATGIEHVRLAQEAKKSEIVHVMGDISHDIKNMVTPIMTGVWTLEPMLQRLFEQLDDIAANCPETETWGEEVRSAAGFVRNDYDWLLENVITAAEQVQARTREIADAIKGEMSPPYFELADFNERCKAVVNTLKVVAAKAGVNLVLELDPELPSVEIDRKQIYNAMYNLINNAIPFTPPGGRVFIRTRGPQPGEETFTVEVSDTGKGMPENVRARLFTEASVSTTPGGTGLGTQIVGGVIRRHHGKIEVQSELGKGSTFTITLPLKHEPQLEAL